MLSTRSLHSATVLHSNRYYTVCSKYFLGKRCFLKSNMRSSIGQNFRLFSAILPKVTRPSNAHVLIKYVHVLMCVGEGSRHFSAIHYYKFALQAMASDNNGKHPCCSWMQQQIRQRHTPFFPCTATLYQGSVEALDTPDWLEESPNQY